jgi:hypothetical protein
MHRSGDFVVGIQRLQVRTIFSSRLEQWSILVRFSARLKRRPQRDMAMVSRPGIIGKLFALAPHFKHELARSRRSHLSLISTYLAAAGGRRLSERVSYRSLTRATTRS